MNVYTLAGDAEHAHLLNFVLTKQSLPDTIAVIVIDLTRPWLIPEALNRFDTDPSVLLVRVIRLVVASSCFLNGPLTLALPAQAFHDTQRYCVDGFASSTSVFKASISDKISLTSRTIVRRLSISRPGACLNEPCPWRLQPVSTATYVLPVIISLCSRLSVIQRPDECFVRPQW